MAEMGQELAPLAHFRQQIRRRLSTATAGLVCLVPTESAGGRAVSTPESPACFGLSLTDLRLRNSAHPVQFCGRGAQLDPIRSYLSSNWEGTAGASYTSELATKVQRRWCDAQHGKHDHAASGRTSGPPADIRVCVCGLHVFRHGSYPAGVLPSMLPKIGNTGFGPLLENGVHLYSTGAAAAIDRHHD